MGETEEETAGDEGDEVVAGCEGREGGEEGTDEDDGVADADGAEPDREHGTDYLVLGGESLSFRFSFQKQLSIDLSRSVRIFSFNFQRVTARIYGAWIENLII